MHSDPAQAGSPPGGRTRREALALLAGGACCACSWSTAEASQWKTFCLETAQDPDNIEGLVRPAAYDRGLARIVDLELVFLQEFFKTRDAGFWIYPGTDETFGRVAVDGRREIVLGTGRYDAYRHVRYGMLKLAGVLAHESAHLFQIRTGIDKSLVDQCGHRVKMVELHADYMAGAYMAWRSVGRKDAPTKISDLFFSLGDNATYDHHGTPQERAEAFQYGYADCLILMKKGLLDLTQIAAEGMLRARRCEYG